jgi:hypothetical protein
MPDNVDQERRKQQVELINSAMKAAGTGQQEFPGVQLDKVLKSLEAIHGMCDTLTKGHAEIKQRLDEVEKRGAPGDGKHLPMHRGATPVDDEDDRTEEERRRGEPKRVVADADAERGRDLMRDHLAREKERAGMADAQYKAEQACSAWGGSAAFPMSGETLLAFRRRLLRPWMKYSKEFGEVDVSTLDEPLLTPVENRVYQDAIAASSDPSIGFADQLREVRRKDQSGREMIEFYGEPRVWMQQFAGNRRRVLSFRNTSTLS